MVLYCRKVLAVYIRNTLPYYRRGKVFSTFSEYIVLHIILEFVLYRVYRGYSRGKKKFLQYLF